MGIVLGRLSACPFMLEPAAVVALALSKRLLPHPLPHPQQEVFAFMGFPYQKEIFSHLCQTKSNQTKC